MTVENERIAKLEERAGEIVRRLGTQDADLTAIRKDVHEIKESLSRFKGFASGVIFAISLVSGLVGAALTAIWHRLGN